MAAILGLMYAALAFAADTATVTVTDVPGSDIKKHTVSWQADVFSDKANVSIPWTNGYVLMVVTDPGSTAPADDYAITLTDSDGANIMAGADASGPMTDLDTANTEQWVPKFDSGVYGARYVAGTITAAFTDQAVADCNGEFHIYGLPAD